MVPKLIPGVMVVPMLLPITAQITSLPQQGTEA